jgi:hypothetical protein
MKLFSQEEVAQKMAEFNGYVMKEKELQEELLALDISGSKDKVKLRVHRHDEILEEIKILRMEKMMPILEEMTKFVAYCEKVEKGEIQLGDPFPGESEPVEIPKKQEQKSKN